MKLRVAYKKDGEVAETSPKRLPMDKDPIFLANLRKQIIEDHNNKIKAKQLKKAL